MEPIREEAISFEIRGLQRLDLNGLYTKKGKAYHEIRIRGSPIYVQLASQGFCVYRTPCGWNIGHRADLPKYRNGLTTGFACCVNSQWLEHLDGQWKEADLYIRYPTSPDSQLYKDPLNLAVEERATERFIAKRSVEGFHVSAPQGIQSFPRDDRKTITATVKIRSMLTGDEFNTNLLRGTYRAEELPEDGTSEFQFLSLRRGPYQLAHWSQGLYGLWEDGQLVARETGPMTRWVRLHRDGSEHPVIVDMEWKYATATEEEIRARAPQPPEPPEPQSSGRQVVHYRSNPAANRVLFEEYRAAKEAAGKLVPQIDLEKHSDLTIWREVIYNRVYQDFKGRDSTEVFLVKPNDVLLDVGGNIGLATFFYFTLGVLKGDVCEPAQGCHATLEANLSLINRHRGRFQLHKVAVGTQRSTVTFEDRTACAQGGSSRSAVVTGSLKERANSQRYEVQVVPFSEVLQNRHTVVKMDCEGAELPILLSTTDWKRCRLLVCEISVLQMRKAEENAWQKLANIFDNLKAAGFRYARLSRTFFELQFWDEKGSSGKKQYSADKLIHFSREEYFNSEERTTGRTQKMPPKSRGRFCIWWHYRRIMQSGGLLPGGDSLDDVFLDIQKTTRT